MNQRRTIVRLAVPLGLTALLLCARLVSVPALSDPVSGAAPASLGLAVPWLYLALAPLFTLWDGVSMLSMGRLRGFLFGLVTLYLAWRVGRLLWPRLRGGAATRLSILKEIRILAVSLLLLAAFLVGGALWHRPMLALTGAGESDIVVDFHSHTNVSHDVRGTWMRGFDTEANQRWHARAGFDAAFITDHNVRSRQSPVTSRESRVEEDLDGHVPWHRGERLASPHRSPGRHAASGPEPLQ